MSMACPSLAAIQVVEARTFLELALTEAEEPCRERKRCFSDGAVDYCLRPEALSSCCATPATLSTCDSDASQCETLSECGSVASLASEEAAIRSASSQQPLWSDALDDDLDGASETAAATEASEAAPSASSDAKREARWPERQRVNPWGSANVAACDGRRVPSEWTTLVLKRLPEGCSQQAVVDLLGSLGLGASYNFAYAPMNFRTLNVFGFCFVDFVSHDVATEAMQKLMKVCWQEFGGAQLEVYWSEPHQGLEVHLERYRNSPVMHRAVPAIYKPILLRNGKRVPFPKPTQSVYPPKDWSRRFNGRRA